MAHDNEQRLRTFHLFAGAGGGILADLLFGHIPVGACEIEDYPRAVLLQRQRDGILPKFPIWDDVCTFDGKPWRGKVDVVCGGFPCPDFSNANQSSSRQTGLEGERGRLWFETLRIIREIRPGGLFLENVRGLLKLGIGRVLSDLHESGYNARWCMLGSDDTGGLHKRKRIWIYAFYPDSNGLQTGKPILANVGQTNENKKNTRDSAGAVGMDGVREYVIPHIVRKDDAVANWMDRFKAVGNGQDASVARLAWEVLNS